jgi:hypothetical protein
MRLSMSRVVTLFLASLFLWPVAAPAQFALRSTIDGTVSDASGAGVPGATVTLKETTRNLVLVATSDARGLYVFSNLASGVYTVSAELAGFAKAVSDPITLGSGTTVTADLQLKVQGVAETVEVKAAAPLITTGPVEIGASVEKALIDSIAAKGRNFTNFVQFAPTISTQPRTDNAGTWSVGAHHAIGGIDYVAGGGGNNGFYINGVNANDNWVGGQSYTPSLEAVDEIKVDVANFSAANGRDLSSLTVTTRAGSNRFHGSVYDYLENESLNAWDPLEKQRVTPGTEKPSLDRHQFGGNLGGPIVKNKLFFFVNYEQTYNRRGGEPQFYRVPTAAERQGDFSELLRRFPDDPNYVLYDPFSTVIGDDGESSRTPIPNNDLRNVVRPDGTPGIDPRALDMLNMFPLPNYTDPTDPNNLQNYQASGTTKFKSYRLDARLDFAISPRDNLYVNFARSSGKDENSGGLFPEIVGNVEDTSWLTSLSYAHIFRSNLTGELVAAYGKGKLCVPDKASVDYMHQTDTLRAKYFQNIGSGEDLGLYAMDLHGYYAFGSYETFCATNPSLQLSSNVNWVKDNHSFRAGFNYFRKEEVDFDYIRFVGFDPTFTRSGTVDGSLGGDSVASFLLGLPFEIQQRYDLGGGDDQLNFVIPYWGFYVEDKWRLNPKWTLSLGLRYDLGLPTYSGNRYGYARVNRDYPGWQLEIPGRAEGLDLHWIPADKNNFAPRVSATFEPRPGLVLRGGYGIFYDLGVTNTAAMTIGEAGFGNVPGYVGDYYANYRFDAHDDVPVMTMDNIFPMQQQYEVGTYPISTGTGTGYFDYPASVQYYDDKSATTPYFHRFVAAVEKQLGSRTLVSLFYSGSRGRQLQYYENQNIPEYRTGWSSEDEFYEARPNNNGRFADVRVMRHGLTSTYNAGTIRLDHRAGDLNLMTHYTYSKTTTDRGRADGAVDQPTGFWDWNRQVARGEAQYSHPHRFVAAATWDMPFGRSSQGLRRALIHGWRLSGVYVLESGDALTVYNAQSSARDFEPDLPNVVGDPNDGPRTTDEYFNTAAFADPGQDVKGNARPGIVRGPGINNLDVSLGKTFELGRDVRAIFRADLYNALNHSQWRYVDTDFSTAAGSTFGRVTEAREARIVQLSLKITF